MQQVVEISKQEQKALKRALRLRGSITRMMEGANVSRTAIVNMRDRGCAEMRTVEKVRTYLAKKAQQASSDKETSAA